MTIRDIFIAFGYKIDEDSEKKAEASIQGLKDTATRLLGALGIGFSIAQVNQLSEEFRTVNDQIEQATRHLEDQHGVQEKILDAANATKTAYADTAKVVTNLVQENTELFGTLDDAIMFNNACTMLFKTAGKTNDQIAGLMESINKSFAKGKVDSETISQLIEQSPEAVALLNRRLGATTDQLEDLAANGKISLKDLRDSFVDSADEIAAAFEKTSFRMSDAFLYIRNKFGLWVAQVDESIGVSQGLGTTLVSVFNKFMGLLQRVTNGIGWLADKVGGMNNLLKLILIVAGSIFGVLKFNQIISGLKAIGTWLTTINLKTLGIIAVVVLLALLVEDFIKFMKGEDSLIGEILEATGVDVEATRQMFSDLWAYLVEGFAIMWEQLQGIFSTCLAIIMGLFSVFRSLLSGDWEQLWADLYQLLLNGLTLIDQLFTLIFGDIWTAVKEYAAGIAQSVMDGLQTAIDFITGLPSQAVTWGKDIIQGICDGIWAGISWVAEAASGIASEIKKFIGFSEPEEGPLSNFHTYMPDMIDLMTTGIRAGRTKVREAMSELSGDVSANASLRVLSTVQRAASVAPQTLRASQNSSTSKIVNQTNNFNNEFHGGRDVQRNASTAMTKASGNATGQLARALAFVN